MEALRARELKAGPGADSLSADGPVAEMELGGGADTVSFADNAGGAVQSMDGGGGNDTLAFGPTPRGAHRSRPGDLHGKW